MKNLFRIFKQEKSRSQYVRFNGFTAWFDNTRISLREFKKLPSNWDSYLNRDNGPALITDSGEVSFYANGYLHNTEGPAIIWPEGTLIYALGNQMMAKDEWKQNRNSYKKFNRVY